MGTYRVCVVVCKHVKEHLQSLRCCEFTSANLDTISYR